MADDPYRIADKVDANMLEMMAARLEERGRDAQFLQMIDDYLRFPALRCSDQEQNVLWRVLDRIEKSSDLFG